MKTLSAIPCVLLLCAPLWTQAKPPPAGFANLFNGRDLSGWRGRPQLAPGKETTWSSERREAEQARWNDDLKAHWRIEDGEIVNDGGGVYLTTLEDHGDFELLLDYRTVAKADSGIYLRGCPQVQIWDTTEEGGKWAHGADKGSGSLWNNQRHPRFPLQVADRPFGAWNTLRIVMVGSRVSVWMNDLLVVDHTVLENYFDRDRPIPPSGPIQFQTHGGEIRFRNVHLRAIPSAEANRILLQQGKGGFRPLFNGKDLSGWGGAVDGYVVSDGTIGCKPRSGGTLYTEDEFGDFVARLEFLLPPGGNNGLAIRHPGKGDAAYDAMCEIQVLDDSHPKYAGIQPWQAHGSAYGLVSAHRGYLRPTGTWNVQEVTVQGSSVRVELNGTIILDADLSPIDAPLSEKEHPGRLRTRGHFGFCGHQDPVRFRNVFVRSLD
jgi:hypothetical protein